MAAGLVDVLLEDDGYLAYADLERLAPAARHARTRAARLRGCLLELTPQAAVVTGGPRTAMFSVTDVLEGLGAGTGTSSAPYRGLWARTGVRAEHSELNGHTDDVNAACQVQVAGEPMLATASSDRTVRLWDPVNARLDRVLSGHSASVQAVCAVSGDGRELVASGGADHTVRLWDPVSGQAVQILAGHADGVGALCRLTAPEGEWLASGGADATVRLWDPATGLTVRVLAGHTGSITALCEVRPALLASASWDGTVRLWDPGSGRLVRVLEHGVRGERGMCVLTVEGRALLATAGSDGSVHLSDPGLPADARPQVIGKGLDIEALCPVRVGGRDLLAIAENNGPYEHVVRFWDPAYGRPLEEMRSGDPIRAMCEVSFGGRIRLAIADVTGDPSMFAPGNGTVRLADPGGAASGPVSHTEPVTALAVAGTLLASASSDHTVRLWDPATGRAIRALRAHVTEVRAVCSMADTLLASAGDTTVGIWRPETGEAVTVLRGHTGAVAAVCPVASAGQWLLASGAYDREIRLWNPATGQTVRVLEHPGSVYALRTVEVEGRTLLASAGMDAQVRLWDPATGHLSAVIPVRDPATACVEMNGTLMIGLDTGVLAIRLDGRWAAAR